MVEARESGRRGCGELPTAQQGQGPTIGSGGGPPELDVGSSSLERGARQGDDR
jgi:hypothetical protein